MFEAQILPTILSFIPQEEVSLEELKDEKEWSSVLLYTCEKNCTNEEEYVAVLPPLWCVCSKIHVSYQTMLISLR